MILADVEWKTETKILSLIDTWMMDSFLRWTARKEVTDYLHCKFSRWHIQYSSYCMTHKIWVVSFGTWLVHITLNFSLNKEDILWKGQKEVSIYFTIEPSESSVEWISPYPKFERRYWIWKVLWRRKWKIAHFISNMANWSNKKRKWLLVNSTWLAIEVNFERFSSLEHFHIRRGSFSQACIKNKWGRVFPKPVVSILPHADFGPNHHWEDAPHFSRT